MERVLKVDALELNEIGKVVAAKGRMVKVYDLTTNTNKSSSSVVDVKDFDSTCLSHTFKDMTLKNLFFAQFELDYCGG